MNRGILHLGRAAGLIAVLVAPAACQLVGGIEDTSLFEGDGGPGGPDGGGGDGGTPSERFVRGVAGGVVEPVALRLQLSDGSELLSVTGDGPFAFQTPLEEGVSYTVSLEGQPPCALDRASGTIAGADGDIALSCNGAATLSELVLLGPSAPDLALMPTELGYTAEVSLLQQRISIAATAQPGTMIRVAGMPVDSGTPSPPVPLVLGDNEVEIVLEHSSGLRRTYRVNVRRAADVAQFVYGKASNAEGLDRFGQSVALDGDTLAVGATGEDSGAAGVNGDQGNNTSAANSGAVYVFRRTPQGWVQEAYVKASNPDTDDGFGFSVALSGDFLAVGATGEDSASLTNPQDDTAAGSGAVYVFRRSGSGWAQEAYIKASNLEAGDIFGHSVALSGDTLAVGATGEDSPDTGVNSGQGGNDTATADSGAVYVFRRDTNGGWAEEAYVKAFNTDGNDQFGIGVALSNDTLAVGASGEDSVSADAQLDDSATDSGAVYVFRRTNGNWAQEAYLKASNVGARDRFGQRVALSNDLLAVAAPQEDSASTGVNGVQANDGAADSGAVYVFERTGTAWTQEAYVKASNTAGLDNFGQSVALAGDVLAVGAFFEDSASAGVGGDDTDDSLDDSGAAYVFVRAASGWTQAGYIKAFNPGGSDLFGFSVALGGDALVVGASNEDSSDRGIGGDGTNNTASDSGAAYIFH